ncbi:MAG: hypothetical protein COV66_05860 [Nitrospinae bacterium CG11_big_fil_rev_8_21_14_0_20_45_15]|nr:MAG: hypothetical protein COV66_05860 [Nitrospinae bacterium CG11_big_fil_rev_8_21_14_0_20_45_15]
MMARSSMVLVGVLPNVRLQKKAIVGNAAGPRWQGGPVKTVPILQGNVPGRNRLVHHVPRSG